MTPIIILIKFLPFYILCVEGINPFRENDGIKL